MSKRSKKYKAKQLVKKACRPKLERVVEVGGFKMGGCSMRGARIPIYDLNPGFKLIGAHQAGKLNPKLEKAFNERNPNMI